MALQKYSYIDQIEINPNGDVGVRMVLCVEENGKELSRNYHRTMIPFEHPNPTAQMAAVNQHIQQLGSVPIGAADLARLSSIFATIKLNTPGGRGQRGR